MANKQLNIGKGRFKIGYLNAEEVRELLDDSKKVAEIVGTTYITGRNCEKCGFSLTPKETTFCSSCSSKN